VPTCNWFVNVRRIAALRVCGWRVSFSWRLPDVDARRCATVARARRVLDALYRGDARAGEAVVRDHVAEPGVTVWPASECVRVGGLGVAANPFTVFDLTPVGARSTRRDSSGITRVRASQRVRRAWQAHSAAVLLTTQCPTLHKSAVASQHRLVETGFCPGVDQQEKGLQ